MGQLTFNQVVEKLVAKEVVTTEEQQQISAFDRKENTTPWYIYGLITLAAWFSTVFFLIFFFAALFNNPEKVAFISGIILTIGAVVLNTKRGKDSIFFNQVSLAFNISGQILIVVGIADMVSRPSFGFLVGTVIIMQIVVSFFYRHPIQHFGAPIVISCALTAFFFDIKGENATHLIIAVLALATGYLWYKESSFVKYKPLQYITYGVTISLLAIISMSVVSELKIYWWISGAVLTMALLSLEALLLQELSTTRTGFITLGVTALFCLLTINSPGLIVAIFTLLLGFYRGNKLLTLISFLFFAGFLFFFYYNIDMTLLNKSLILMGNGILFIVFSHFIHNLKIEASHA